MRWAAEAPDRTIHCVQPRPLATKACPLHVDDNGNLERRVQSQGSLERGKVARHVGGTSRGTKNSTARPTRPLVRV